MKKIKFIFIFFLFFCFFTKAQNSFIIAGQYNPNDYYHMFTPDTNYAGSTTTNYSVDVNNDGIFDFQFNIVPYTGALGAWTYYFGLSGLDSNKVVLGSYDTCFNNSFVYQFKTPMAKAFHYNDTINAFSNWNNLVYLSYYSGHMSYPPSANNGWNCGFNYSQDSAFIGLQLKKGTDTLYGWIKIISVQVGWDTFNLKINSLACNNNVTGIQEMDNKMRLNIYPNPADIAIHIDLKNNIKIIEIELYDLLGKEVRNAKEKDIDVRDLQEGIYFMHIKTSEGVWANKIIIQR
jgi:hypothetical protein